MLGVTASVITIYALLGFFLAPWLLQKLAVESVAERTGAELRLGEVAINPFVLSLRIRQLELDDPAGEQFTKIDEVFVA